MTLLLGGEIGPSDNEEQRKSDTEATMRNGEEEAARLLYTHPYSVDSPRLHPSPVTTVYESAVHQSERGKRFSRERLSTFSSTVSRSCGDWRSHRGSCTLSRMQTSVSRVERGVRARHGASRGGPPVWTGRAAANAGTNATSVSRPSGWPCP